LDRVSERPKMTRSFTRREASSAASSVDCQNRTALQTDPPLLSSEVPIIQLTPQTRTH